MVIQGLKKFTLLDYPGKMACTLFAAGCNFRCPYCYNKPLVIDTHENRNIPLEDIYAVQRDIGRDLPDRRRTVDSEGD